MKTKAAIIILNYNGAECLRRYLPSVLEHSAGYEVIVADNASTDNSLAVMSSLFPKVRTIVFPQNYGFAEGYNQAISRIEAEYIVLLNSDVTVPEGWLSPLIAFMDAHGKVAACQPKLLSMREPDHFEYAGASGGYIDKFGYPFCRGRIFGTLEQDFGQYDTMRPVLWATGACLVVRRRDYVDLHGLDARFFAHNEEIDLCWRFWLKGREVWSVPKTAVYHYGGATLPKGNPKKTYLNFRNNLLMLYKNLPEERLKPVMRWRYWLDRLAMVEMLVFGRSLADAKAVLQGRRDFHKMLPLYAPIRREIQQNACHKGSPVAQCSILWQYYVKHKRLFSQLPKALLPNYKSR